MAGQTFSLPEVHESVSTAHGSLWRRMFAFAGPAYLVSVGYMDPGNWATDLEGGARFGYKLIWVLLVSNLMALLLQTLSARLGIVTRRDLAQACRDEYSKPTSVALWLLCELAIVACDLAEVLGAAIGLQLLFHVPLLAGVLLTAADTLLILWLSRLGIRVIEAFVLVLIATIGGCFAFEIFLARPQLGEIARGVVPHLDSSSIYVAVAILGATVMPHNLYLHSALVQTRRIGDTLQEKAAACRFNLVDSTVALNGALLVNAAILIMAAAVFFKHRVVVTEIGQAHQLLSPLLGTTAASILFGTALLCSGQSSTLTGTMAGQIAMEGFLHFRMQPWLRRAVTRFLAITPAVLAIIWYGDAGTYKLILVSQVVLSLQLPFAVIPLVHFTSDRKRMGSFANSLLVQLAAWACAACILLLNLWYLSTQVHDWIAAKPQSRPLVWFVVVLGGSAFLYLLIAIIREPSLHRKAIVDEPILPTAPLPASDRSSLRYRRVLVTLDHSTADEEAVSNALALARVGHSQIYVLHVEEGVTSQLFGSQSSTAEIQEGQDYLSTIVSSLEAHNLQVHSLIRHGKPATEIVAAIQQISPDLVIMASHGHTGFKDLIFGTTINSVRHRVKVPLLIVSKP